MKKDEKTCPPAGRAALYDPYLDVMGGGEKHILSILQVIEQNGFDVSVFWDDDLKNSIRSKLNLNFNDIHFSPNIFRSSSPLQKLRQLKTYDILLYVTDGSYFFSSAKKNIIFCMVPNRSLYNLDLINKAKTLNAVFIANSIFTQRWLKKWGITAKVIYPYVTDDLMQSDPITEHKEKWILSVGRFFKHLHTKNHHRIIETFLAFQKNYPDFKLILAGGLKNEDSAYLEEINHAIKKNGNIVVKPNVSYSDLLNLYRKSMFFWHFTGYGIDEDKHPEQVEHFGLTPLEAMAAGTVPFCYASGGPKEFIEEGKNGFLFETEQEIIRKTIRLLSDNDKYQTIQKNGRDYVSKYFSYEVFKEKVKKILL